MLSPSIYRLTQKRKRQKRFNLHSFLLNARLVAIEIAAAVVFFAWLFKAVKQELGW